MGKTLSKPGGGTPPSASGVDHPWAIFPGGAPCQTSDIAGLPWELTNESRNSVCEKGNEAHDGAARAIQSVARRQRARRHVDGVAGALLRPLRVTVLSGKDLRGADFGGASSDPYIIAHVVDDDGAQIFLQRSPVKKMTRCVSLRVPASGVCVPPSGCGRWDSCRAHCLVLLCRLPVVRVYVPSLFH